MVSCFCTFERVGDGVTLTGSGLLNVPCPLAMLPFIVFIILGEAVLFVLGEAVLFALGVLERVKVFLCVVPGYVLFGEGVTAGVGPEVGTGVVAVFGASAQSGRMSVESYNIEAECDRYNNTHTHIY